MSARESSRPIEILFVEDNPGDVRLVVDIFKESKMPNHLTVAEDGEKALDILHRRGQYAQSAQPDLILLDLNLPKKDGRQVLSEIKNIHGLKHIPVVVLTTSQSEEDVLKSYELHANCFITKPYELERFISVIRMIEDFWFSVVRLPTLYNTLL